MSSFAWRYSKLDKPRRLGRGLEALLGRGPAKPQIHVPPEDAQPAEDDPTDVTPIQVNQPPLFNVIPRRIEPVRRPDAGISLEPPGAPPERAGSPSSAEPASPLGATLEAMLHSLPSRSEPDAGQVLDAPTRTGDSPSSLGPPVEATDTLLHVDIDLIETNPFQPRKDFSPEELAQLSQSIEEHGLLQPLLVRRVDETYQLIAGERRLRAAQAAGWREVPVRVVEAQDRQMSELALVENLQRKDLNAMEKAASFKQYLQTAGCTQEELAKRLKLDRSTIANLIRLLELPEAVQAAVRQGRITQGHARALLTLGDERRQIELAERVEREGLSVRAIEAVVQDIVDAEDREPLSVVGQAGVSKKPKSRPRNEQIAALEQEFRAALGLKVKLVHNARGRGKLTIQFSNHDEFDRLRQHLVGREQSTSQQKAG